MQNSTRSLLIKQTLLLVIVTIFCVNTFSQYLDGPDIVSSANPVTYTLKDWHVGFPSPSNLHYSNYSVTGGTITHYSGQPGTPATVVWNLSAPLLRITCDYQVGFFDHASGSYLTFNRTVSKNITVITGIEFSYDPSGNRVSRTIFLPNLKSATINNTNESFFESQDVKHSYEDKIDNYQFYIYPNPVKDELTIESKFLFDDLPAKANVAIYSLNGIKVRDEIITDNITPINLTGLPSGVYILLISINDQTSQWRIIKQ